MCFYSDFHNCFNYLALTPRGGPNCSNLREYFHPENGDEERRGNSDVFSIKIVTKSSRILFLYSRCRKMRGVTTVCWICCQIQLIWTL